MGAGSYLSWDEWCAIWGKVHGVTCTFEKEDRKWMDENLGHFGREMADMFQYWDECGYDGVRGGGPDVVYPWDLGVEVQVTSAEEYIKKEDWSSIL